MKNNFIHDTDSENCWCNPAIETMPNGNKVVIHNEETELDRVQLAIETAGSTAGILRGVRKARGLTILQVAAKTGLHRNYVSSIERGDKINSASLTAIAKIAHALGCVMQIQFYPFEKVTQEGEK